MRTFNVQNFHKKHKIPSTKNPYTIHGGEVVRIYKFCKDLQIL